MRTVVSTETHRPEADSFVEAQIRDLDLALSDLDLPPVVDRSARPRRGGDGPNEMGPNDITIVLLSDPDYRLALSLEGAKQSPGTVLTVCSPAWMTKVTETLADGSKEAHLLVHEALTVSPSGQYYRDTFDPPRRASYFANFLTLPATCGVRGDGVPLEENLSCPMSSSSLLEGLINDKLLTRVLLARARVGYPTTLAFPFQPIIHYDLTGTERISLQVLKTRDESARERISAAARRFLPKLRESGARKVVTKPSGKMWMGSQGVTIHAIADEAKIIAALEALLAKVIPGDSLLCEAFIDTIPGTVVMPLSDVPIARATGAMGTLALEESADVLLEEQDYWAEENVSEELTASTPAIKLGFRLRVICARTADDKVIVSQMVAGISRSDRPVNGDNTVPQSLDTTLRIWGINDQKHRSDIINTVTEEARATLNAIMEFESAGFPGVPGAVKANPPRARTEMIGIDFVLTSREGAIVPVVIEVNDHDSTLQAQTLEFILRGTSDIGRCAREWITAMIRRAENHALCGRTIVYVGGGGYSKRFTFEIAKELGVRIVLVDGNDKHYARSVPGFVDTFIHVPGFSEHSRDAELADTIVAKLRALESESGSKIDGVMTFWEDCVQLNAMVAKMMGLCGNDPEAAMLGKSKLRTHEMLLNKHESLQHRVSCELFAIPTFRCGTAEQVATAIDETGIPVLVKTTFGSSAFGVKLCKSLVDVNETVKALSSYDDEKHPGVGFGFSEGGGDAVILQQYCEGLECDLDCIMYNGKLITGVVTDNAVTRLPYFSETAALMPSRLPPDQQALILNAGVIVLRSIGLIHGAFNVEFKLTATGPKVIDINGRMGGFYIRDWVKRTHGMDLASMAMLCSIGVKPVAATPVPTDQRRCYIAGYMLYASQHGTALETTARPERLQMLAEEGGIIYTQFEEKVPGVEEYEEPFANIGMTGTTPKEAIAALESTLKILGLDAPNTGIRARYFLSTLEDY
jgi:carnosine synthase